MVISAIVACVGSAYLTGHWIGGVAAAVLCLVWWLLRPEEGPPILALALTFQWVQVSLGVFYTPLTGDVLLAFINSDWQRMVLVGLGCVACLAIGLRFGTSLVQRKLAPVADAPSFAVSDSTLWIAYVASVCLTGVVQELAWQFPSFTQAILALNFAHLALLFVLLRRLSRPVFYWPWVIGLLLFEVGLGFTGYFAGFREPLVMGFIMMTEIFNPRKAGHWGLMAAVVLVLSATSLVWMSVRDEYREDFSDELATATRADRLERVQSLADAANLTGVRALRNTGYALADRMWTIYYPALALERVPTYLPHENGRIIGTALLHLVTPRALFPNKAPLPSDSEMVRKYSDVNVAGAERGTSIAFGYAAESYVDFGIPLMFLPVLVWGIVAGVTYQLTLRVIYHRELAISVATVIFWLSLYLFERSWVKTLGLHVTLLVYLGGVTFLLDRFLMGRRQQLMADIVTQPAFHPGR
jgi:hypothetical protein